MAAGREIRLALVLNGGVSLAVWIGGVTREIDAARRSVATGPHDTQPLYAEILEALDYRLVVDVIGGASAGGINGVLLGASIYNGVPLPNLRETWISLGDFRSLLRSPSESNPPSLMQGDQVVLAQLRQVVDGIWVEQPRPAQAALYVYITATDLFGYPVDFADSFGRAWEERDHRRVFAFQHEEEPQAAELPVPRQELGAMRPLVRFHDPDVRELLARAARSSSSFPVAFEAHELGIVDRDRAVHLHWLVDGGILDNQPFNPVLDRISVLKADCPVRRVVMYVVPYVTEVGATGYEVPPTATARDTYGAAGTLPRDLPKLQGLERITRAQKAQDAAATERERVRAALAEERLHDAAASLVESYRASRYAETHAVFTLWNRPDFPSGHGTIAQDPAVDPHDILSHVDRISPVDPPPVAWIPDGLEWIPADRRWRWGLSPAERAAAWALLFVRDAVATLRPEDGFIDARKHANALVAEVRSAKIRLRERFRALREHPDEDVLALAAAAYEELDPELREIQQGFVELDDLLRPAHLSVQDMLDVEVVRNALALQEIEVPVPFRFLFASAGIRNSLGHSAEYPEDKLAGLKLGHFAGFLKRSWRANDWLWGRLDGVEHLVEAIVTADGLDALADDGRARLAAVAFGGAPADELAVLAELWRTTLHSLGVSDPDPGDARASFLAVLGSADSEAARLPAARRALAARIQLRVLGEDLERVAETARDDVAAGASRISNGAFWAERVHGKLDAAQRLQLFRDLEIGQESPKEEASSRLVLDLGAEGVAVAAAMLAGDKGGLPVVARGMLSSARGITLSLSRLIQVLAREPWIGAAIFTLLVALVIWAGISKSTLIGAVFPGLTLLVAVVGFSLLTIATSAFDLPMQRPSRWVGVAFLAGVPAAFGVLALALHWVGWGVPGWLDRHLSEGVTLFAGGAALVAAALALLPAATPPRPGGWRSTAIGLYRAVVTVTIAVAAGAVLVERWRHQARSGKLTGWAAAADEHRGTILVLLLVVALLAAAAIEAGLARQRRGLRD